MGAGSMWLWQERLKGRWQGSAVQGFCRAWGQELLASLPAALRHALQPGRAPRHCPWPLPVGIAEAGPVILDLPADTVLVQHLALPLAAARDLHQVMDYELDRFTPFTADQVHYVVRRDRVSGEQLWVTLALVRREWLQACLDTCSAQGLTLAGIAVLDADGETTGLDLLPSAHQPATHARGRRLAMGMGVLCLLLAAAIPAAWLHNRSLALAAMQAEVNSLRQQASEVATLRTALDDAQGAAQFLLKRRMGQPSRALLLSELTACLPSDTWLQRLDINADGQVDLAGFSARASALIGQIKGCSHLTQAQYQGVIQPDEATGRDRFYMRAQARGEADNAPRPDTP